MHFWKSEDKWHYVSEEGYKQIKCNNMSLPSICFATKTYIPDIEKKGWPEINEDELLVENSDLENQVKYIANNMDGNELITPIPESIEEAIFTPEAHDVNPLIFYRLSRNVREGKVLPQLDLSRYFEKSGNNGFKLTISPVYTLSMDSGIIEKYQSKYEEVKSAIQDFDPALKQEFKLVFDKLMRKNLSETTKNSVDCPTVADFKSSSDIFRNVDSKKFQFLID